MVTHPILRKTSRGRTMTQTSSGNWSTTFANLNSKVPSMQLTHQVWQATWPSSKAMLSKCSPTGDLYLMHNGREHFQCRSPGVGERCHLRRARAPNMQQTLRTVCPSRCDFPLAHVGAAGTSLHLLGTPAARSGLGRHGHRDDASMNKRRRSQGERPRRSKTRACARVEIIM